VQREARLSKRDRKGQKRTGNTSGRREIPMRFEIEDYGKGVKLHITYSGLSLKQILEALMAPYDEKIMDELVNSPRFYSLKNRGAYERKGFLAKRIFRGRLAQAGALDIYLKYRDDFLKSNDQSKNESEERK
jgi:hypothetical protein